MKRWMTAVLALALVLMLCACGVTEQDVIGLWQRETVYLPHYECEADLYIAFISGGDYMEVLFNHDTGALLNMEAGSWEIVKGKVEAQEAGEDGITEYSRAGKNLKNGDLKYTRIGETSALADLLG